MIVLPKQAKNLTKPGAFRLISLLNVDYKSLATVLAKRLNCILRLYIHKDQAEFLKNRYMKNNVWRVMKLLNVAQMENIPTIFYFLDTAKAFD